MTIAHVTTHSLDVTRATYRLKLLLLRMRRGTVTLADNALMAKEVYKNFFEFVDRSPVFWVLRFLMKAGLRCEFTCAICHSISSGDGPMFSLGTCLPLFVIERKWCSNRMGK